MTDIGVDCQRWFIITPENLDAKYEEWLELHFDEILELPEPEYESLKTYRRGLQSKRNWILAIDGKIYEEVFFTRKDLSYKDMQRKNPGYITEKHLITALIRRQEHFAIK